MRHEGRESGFGVVEIVVSMFLLGLIAIAFLPLLVQSLRVSVSNSTLATATQLVTQQMEELRSLGTSCATLDNYANTPFPTVTAAGNHVLTITIALDCPAASAAYPTTVPATVSVTEKPDLVPIATAATLILVQG
jgi:Tfp pilus assembly protein PilV